MKNSSFIVLISLLFSIVSFASEEIGRVVNLRGEVLRSNPERGIEPQALKAGAQLFAGDQLISGERSFARLLMKDETLFQVGPETTFVVEKFDFKEKNDRQATYHLVAGRLRSVFTQKAQENDLFIKTPTASMGIRGTEILSDVYRVDGVVRTDIALLSGKLDVMTEDLNQTVKTVTLQPGFVYETKINLENQIVQDSEMRRLPQNMLAQLTTSASNGGHTFLFDASVAEAPKSREGASFDLKVVSSSPDASDLESKSRPALKVAPSSELQPVEIKRVPAGQEREVLPNKIDSKINETQDLKSEVSQPQKVISEPSRISAVNEPVKLETTTVQASNEPVKLETTTVQTFNEPVKLNTTTVQTFNEPVKLETTTVQTFNDPVKLDTRTVETFNEPVKIDTSTTKLYEPVNKFDTITVQTYNEPIKVAPVYEETTPIILKEPTSFSEPIIVNETIKNVDTVTDQMIQDSFVREQDRMAQETMITEQEKITTETTKTITKEPLVETITAPTKVIDDGSFKVMK